MADRGSAGDQDERINKEGGGGKRAILKMSCRKAMSFAAGLKYVLTYLRIELNKNRYLFSNEDK